MTETKSDRPPSTGSRLSDALLGASFVLYGAGLGLISAVVLFVMALGTPFTRLRSRSSRPRSSGSAPVHASVQPWRRLLPDYGYPLLFVGAAAASAVGSASPSAAWGGVALLAVMVVIFWFAASRRLEPERIRKAALQLAFGGVLLAAMSLDGFVQSRVHAATPFIGKNGVGTLLAMALPMAQLGTVGGVDPVVAWAGVLVILTALFLSMSQGGWVGAVAGQLVLLASSSPRLRRNVVLLGLVAALVAGTLGLYVMESGGPARQLLLSRLELRSSSKTERILIWEAAWQMFLDHPWRGVGIGAFGSAYPRYRLPQASEPEVSFAHNLFFNLLAETGLFGFVTFALVVGVWGRYAVRAVRGAAPDRRDLAAAVLAGLVGMLVHQLFDGTMWSLHIGIGFWLLGAMLFNLRRPQGQEGTSAGE